MSYRRLIIIAHATVLVVGILLSTLVYFQGRAVVHVSRLFAESDLVDLKTISGLKIAVVEYETILYEFYANTDRSKFSQKRQLNEANVAAGLDKIRAAFPSNNKFTAIEENYALVKLLSGQLDDTLKQREIDWDKARFLLLVISQLSTKINDNLDALVSSIQSRVLERGQEIQRKINYSVALVALFSATFFVVSIFVGYYVNTYLSEIAERRRLSMFAERNPNPVLSLSQKGEVVYASPSALELLKNVGTKTTRFEVLFPDDLAARLVTLFESGKDRDEWEYTVLGKTFSCGINLLRDLGIAHAHLLDITERRAAEGKLVFLAYHDVLTGLPNRQNFQEKVDRALKQIGDAAGPAILLLIIDRFEWVVGSLGHIVGDKLIQAVAQHLVSVLGDSGAEFAGASLYRFETDFFSILLPTLESPKVPIRLAEKIVASMNAPTRVAGRELFVTLSIGLSVAPFDGQDFSALTKAADSAMQRARQRGGNSYQCYTQEMNARALAWLELENDLHRAIENEELELYFQPQANVVSGRIEGMEALIRWRHPERGLISPAEFIPLAEETGLIVPISEWTLRRACAQNQIWRDTGYAPMVVAVNASARWFRSPELSKLVNRTLIETGLDPTLLAIEVTESAAMYDIDQTIAILHELKKIGVKLAIDDFGTGYSSLSYLIRLPIDKLKIDQSFLNRLTIDPNHAEIVKAVIALGHALKLKVIAEGVESNEQLGFLREYDCDEIQGYLIGRPMPIQDFELLLKR